MLLGMAPSGLISTVTGFLPSEDCLQTMRAMQSLGASIQRPDSTTLVIEGAGEKFTEPKKVIDCGNSGTSMRLILGILAGQNQMKSKLTGDESLCRRPMNRVVNPLTLMGAKISAEGKNGCAPLEVTGTKLKGIVYNSTVASAQIKSCLLLAGIFAEGKTVVTEPEKSRDHTERIFNYLELPFTADRLKYTISGGHLPKPKDLRVPGDISSAAFWLVAAAARPGSFLRIENVGLNPTRTGILNFLLRMGAKIRENVDEDEYEPSGYIEVQGGGLRGTVIEGADIPNVIDELPILAVAGALASEGVTVIRDAKELRVKETDRIAAMAENLRAIGVEVEDYEDGLAIRAANKIVGARVKSFGDHRIAMAMAIAGLFCEGEMIIEDVDCIQTSYPGFAEDLEKLTGQGR